MLFVALVAATPRSPFPPVLPQGMEPGGPFRWLSDLLGMHRLDESGLMLVGLASTISAAIGFILLAREAFAGRLSMRTAIWLAVAYHVAVLFLPLLFSRDVYSYAYYGRIVSTYGANPYVDTPRDFPLNSLFPLTWPGWRDTPSVYGPLFTWISAGITWSTKGLQATITGFQLLAAAASLGTIAVLARVVTRVKPERAVFAVAMVGLNPIVIFHVVGGGHNDMLVAFFVTVAAAFVLADRHLVAAVMLGLGLSVKASAVVPLVLLMVVVVAMAPPARRRSMLVTYVGVVGGVWLVLALPFLQTTNPTLGLVEVSGHDSWMAPGQVVVRVFGGAGALIAGHGGREVAAQLARLLLFGVSATGVVVVARRLWRDPSSRTAVALLAAWGWAFLLVILPSPVLFTWYLVWTLPLAWALPRVARRSIVVLSGFFVVTQLVTESGRLPELLAGVRIPFGHPIALAVCVWIAVDLIRRMRAGTPLDAETGRPEFGDAFEAGGMVVESTPAAIGAAPVRALRRRR